MSDEQIYIPVLYSISLARHNKNVCPNTTRTVNTNWCIRFLCPRVTPGDLGPGNLFEGTKGDRRFAE
jgi:hypothetical protein